MIPGTELELCRVEAGNGSVVLELHLGEFDTHPVMLVSENEKELQRVYEAIS